MFYFLVNVIGILVFLALGVLLSKRRHAINWRSVLPLLVINIVLAWFLTIFPVGRDIVHLAAEGFTGLVAVAYEGIGMVFPDWVAAPEMNFFTAALLPILFIVPLFDLLTYFGVLPFVINWVGRALAFVTHAPRFESFYAIEMMFLGNTEALAISSLQLKRMKADRSLTVAMLSMSSVSAAIVGMYVTMMPAEFVLVAIPLNAINALIVTLILHPVDIAPEEDVVATLEAREKDREPFFSFLVNSILSAGRLVLIIAATVIAFIALIKFVDAVLLWIYPGFSLELVLGAILFPFAWLLGVDATEAFALGQYMGTKLITNEVVVMLSLGDALATYSRHMQGVLTVFLTSFANFATVGMIIGTFKNMVEKNKSNLIAKNVGYMLLSGLLVSLLSAAIAGLFIW